MLNSLESSILSFLCVATLEFMIGLEFSKFMDPFILTNSFGSNLSSLSTISKGKKESTSKSSSCFVVSAPS